MAEMLLSLLLLLGVVVFRIISVPEIPGPWVVGAIAVVKRKVELVGWW